MLISKRAFIVMASVALIGLAGCKKIENGQQNQAAPVVAAAPSADAAAQAAAPEAAAAQVAAADSMNFEEIGTLPMKGNANGMVTIMEFSDYQCPFCSRAEPTIQKVLEAYPNDVRVAFVHQPLGFHPNAMPAAKAAVAAQKQGKFWQMHEALFANQQGLTADFFKSKAAELGLDVARFEADMNSPETAAFIKKGMDYASAHGIGGTPSFLINGELFVGAQPLPEFQKKVDAALARAKAVAAEKNLSGDALLAELIKTAPKPAPEPDEEEDEAPAGRVHVDLTDAPILGDPEAPVTLVEFTDFQCPFCSRANKTLHELFEANPGKFRIVFRHYPLPFHDKAQLAHQAAEAAKMQGKFWEYYDKLFADQSKLDRDNLIATAKELGLDEAKFVADMDSEAVVAKVKGDIKAGEAAGVRGTPHFFFNGTLLSGAQPLPAFQAALDKEVDAAKAYQDKGLKGNALYEQIIKDNQPAPLVVDNIDASPFLGAKDAVVTIVEFSEFQCPFCNKVEPTLKQLMSDPAYAGKIKLVFKQMPLPFHNNAQKASEASLFAFENGKFWEFHDLMFQNQQKLSIEDLKGYATQVGLDAAALEAALTSDKYKAAVEADVASARKVGVQGTPSFVINGKLVVGALPVNAFQNAIDDALVAAGQPRPTH